MPSICSVFLNLCVVLLGRRESANPYIYTLGVAVSYESDNFAISLITARLHAVHSAKTTALGLAQTSVIYVVSNHTLKKKPVL